MCWVPLIWNITPEDVGVLDLPGRRVGEESKGESRDWTTRVGMRGLVWGVVVERRTRGFLVLEEGFLVSEGETSVTDSMDGRDRWEVCTIGDGVVPFKRWVRVGDGVAMLMLKSFGRPPTDGVAGVFKDVVRLRVDCVREGVFLIWVSEGVFLMGVFEGVLPLGKGTAVRGKADGGAVLRRVLWAMEGPGLGIGFEFPGTVKGSQGVGGWIG